jgi:hypothetical protein
MDYNEDGHDNNTVKPSNKLADIKYKRELLKPQPIFSSKTPNLLALEIIRTPTLSEVDAANEYAI